MNVKEKCLSCLVGQAVKTAGIVNAADREVLYTKVFSELAGMDYSESTPEVFGRIFRLIKAHIGCDDPYREIKARYNGMFLGREKELYGRAVTLADAIKYAIVGNIIDFNPIHVDVERDMKKLFADFDSLTLAIDDTASLIGELESAKTVLYLGDNCGEIVFDKLLISRIREKNPHCRVYFAVRGEPVINDNTYEDAVSVGMDTVAEIISNCGSAPGTVLSQASREFRGIFDSADVIISKGQGNYECLSDVKRPIYFMLMAKCDVIAESLGVPMKSAICKKVG